MHVSALISSPRRTAHALPKVPPSRRWLVVVWPIAPAQSSHHIPESQGKKMTLVRGEEDFRLKRVSGRTGGSQMGNSSAKPDGRNGSGGVGTGRDGTERERERNGCLEGLNSEHHHAHTFTRYPCCTHSTSSRAAAMWKRKCPIC